MDTITLITVIGGVMIVFAILGAVLAGIKNRDLSYWVAWTFLFPPSIIVLAFLPRFDGRRPRRTTLDEEDTMMDKI